MVNNKKSIGIAICSFYGAIALAYIAQILINVLGLYNSLDTYAYTTRVIYIIYNIVCCISMAYIALNKSIRSSLPCQIGATILSALFAVFTINILLYADIYIWDFLGQYAGIIINTIEIIAAFMLFYFIKAWMPVKIFAIVYWIPCLCSTCLIKIASNIMKKTSDWSSVDGLYNAAEICYYINIAIAILTVIFTIIWIKKKPTVAHTQSNPIDTI